MPIKRLFLLAFLIASTLAAPVARAETKWVSGSASYAISGADLFKLRSSLPAEVLDSLKAIRNQRFLDEAAFRAALFPLLLTDQLRAGWMQTLVDSARQPGASFGLEQRSSGIATLIVSSPDHQVDDNGFTSRSWFPALPAATATGDYATRLADACLQVEKSGVPLFSLCHPDIGLQQKSIELVTAARTVVGLGQQFDNPGDTSVNRLGTNRAGLNQMAGFNGGANGNTLFPIAYFDGGPQPFALVLDNRYPQDWNFTAAPFVISVKGGDLRFHVLTGGSLADIRRQYMQLSGTPPVPPKSAFGLWISEYGYDNWAELDSKIDSLQRSGFPLSGVVMDLQWFGGIGGTGGGSSHMGSLTWDRANFPRPEEKIADYARRGIAMMLIEESYIDKSLPEFTVLAAKGYMAHDLKGGVAMTSPTGQWWGHGGMMDWTRPDAAAFWHDFRRQPLVDMGVAGHWTDLGEPEMFNPANLYDGGLTEPMVHNSYNLLWLLSIADGYRRNAPEKRPFMMSRSGGPGMQALGAAMWSGDTGGDYLSLASQMAQQAHMMWSGMDYYGSDIGGFHRGALRHYDGAPSRDAATNDLYTQWFAYSSLFEVPVRPHTENLCNCKETAPDRIGDLKSNLASISLRRKLLPYYYSLAHTAWHTGEPVFPSIAYWYPGEPGAANIGATKMIGRDLIGAAVAGYGETGVRVYLPEGIWYDLRNGRQSQSPGGFLTVPLARDGIFALPVFARDGAVIPVDEPEGPALQIYGLGDGEFSWYDDDGRTTAYQQGVFDQVDVIKHGARLTLTRLNGSAIAPQRLYWYLPAGRSAAVVRINRIPVSFQVVNGRLEVALPAFESVLDVKLSWDQ